MSNWLYYTAGACRSKTLLPRKFSPLESVVVKYDNPFVAFTTKRNESK